MEETDKVTENQEPKLYAGKYKSVEEMEAAFKQIEREASEAKEALDREQRLNSLLSTEPRTVPQAAPTTDYDLSSVLGEDGSKVLKSALEGYRNQVLGEARNLVQETVSSVRAQERAEKIFYKTYAELEDFKDEVDRQAALLAKELGPDRARVVKQEQLFAEVAKRTKEHLSQTKRKLSKAPIHVEDGHVEEPRMQKKTQDQETSGDEAERTKRYFEEEVAQMNKKRNQTLRG